MIRTLGWVMGQVGFNNLKKTIILLICLRIVLKPWLAPVGQPKTQLIRGLNQSRLKKK